MDLKPAEYAWVLALTGLLVYEVWALVTNHVTLSRSVWDATRSAYGPMIPFLTGVLIGHFWFSGK